MFMRMCSAERLLHPGDCGGPLILVGDLQLDEDRLAAAVVDFLDQRVSAVFVPPGDGDRRAFLREQPR
jgi:hypothetical protein